MTIASRTPYETDEPTAPDATARGAEPGPAGPGAVVLGAASSSAAASSAAAAQTAGAALAAALDGPLVSTQWLADHLGAEGLVVLDATVLPSRSVDGGPAYASGRSAFAEGRIPGSSFADLLADFSDPTAALPFTRPEAEAFADAATAAGIGQETTVVVYDAALGQWAARLWYLFRAFGHDRVAVLDGGLAKWSAEGRPLEAGGAPSPSPAESSGPREAGGAPGPSPAESSGPTRAGAAGTAATGPSAPESPFPATEQAGFWVGTAEVAAIVDGTRPGVLVCGTPARDFAARHIPGSTSAPVARLLDRETNAFLPLAQLREVFTDVLEAPGPVVVYCGAGIAAAADALALRLLGRDDVLLYDGSLGEWTADPGAPLESAA